MIKLERLLKMDELGTQHSDIRGDNVRGYLTGITVGYRRHATNRGKNYTPS